MFVLFWGNFTWIFSITWFFTKKKVKITWFRGCFSPPNPDFFHNIHSHVQIRVYMRCFYPKMFLWTSQTLSEHPWINIWTFLIGSQKKVWGGAFLPLPRRRYSRSRNRKCECWLIVFVHCALVLSYNPQTKISDFISLYHKNYFRARRITKRKKG